MQITTTLFDILQHNPCGQRRDSTAGWWKGLEYLGKTEPDNDPLPIETILKSNGIADATWCLRAVNGYDREIRLFACWCAWQALPFWERAFTNDARPRTAIKTAKLFAEGNVDIEELHSAACAAACAADDAATRTTYAAAAYTAATAYATTLTTADAAAAAAAYATILTAADVAADTADAQEEEFLRLLRDGRGYLPSDGIC